MILGAQSRFLAVIEGVPRKLVVTFLRCCRAVLLFFGGILLGMYLVIMTSVAITLVVFGLLDLLCL